MRQLDGTGLKRLHRSWRDRTSGRVALVLDGLGTPANVGSIVRTAAAYRVERLWLAGATPALSGSGVQRTALGTDRYVPSTTVAAGIDAVNEARGDGLTVVGIELCDGAVPLHELALPADCASWSATRTTASPGGARGVRPRGLPPDARPGGLAQRRHGDGDRAVRGAPAQLDRATLTRRSPTHAAMSVTEER